MSRHTSFAHQKNMLDSFLNKLNELSDSLNSLANGHERLLDEMYQEYGLMDEIYSEYKEIFLPLVKNDVSELIRKINEESIPFIEKEIDFFSSH